MIEIINEFTIAKEKFFNILKSNQKENGVLEYDSVTELSKNIFISEDGDINLDYNDLINIFNHDSDINIITLKVDNIKEGLKFILDTKEIDKQKNVCFHFLFNSDFIMNELSDGMQLLYDRANEEANISLCVSSNDTIGLNEVGINCFFS